MVGAGSTGWKTVAMRHNQSDSKKASSWSGGRKRPGFVLGGAVQTGAISGLVHGLLFYLSFIHFIYVILIQHRGFKENIDIIIEVADLSQSKSTSR